MYCTEINKWNEMHTLVHYNISRADGWSLLRLATVAQAGQEDYYLDHTKHFALLHDYPTVFIDEK